MPSRREALRTLAHPTRSRLLGELRVHGPATASALARSLATNTGATSYHLRRLEGVGLIRDTGAGTGRRRVWTATAPDEPSGAAASGVQERDPRDEDDAAARAWLERDYVEHFAEMSASWLDRQGDWPARWRAQCGLRDQTVQVSVEQLTALQAELAEVIERYRRVGAGNPDSKRVSVYRSALPADRPPAKR